MYISKDDAQNCPFCRLQLVVETFRHWTNGPSNQNSIKVPKVLATNKKTLGTNVIKSPISPTSLIQTKV